MEHVNSTIIEGNLVRDPEVKTAKTGNKYCRFSIASSRNTRVGDKFGVEVSFIDISAWGKVAETVGASCKKGSCVKVVGKIRQERWEGADGKKCSRIVIAADHVEVRSSLAARHEAALAKKDAASLVEMLQEDEAALVEWQNEVRDEKEEAVF